MAAELVFESDLRAPRAEVWARISTAEGIADELAPWLRMTFPAEVEQLSESTVPIGRRLCRSWVLLLGVLPIDYDDVTLVELDPGKRFLERSRTASQREWVHERTVEPASEGCRLTDRLEVHPKVEFSRPLLERIVRAIFEHRHQRLVRHFGGVRVR